MGKSLINLCLGFIWKKLIYYVLYSYVFLFKWDLLTFQYNLSMVGLCIESMANNFLVSLSDVLCSVSYISVFLKNSPFSLSTYLCTSLIKFILYDILSLFLGILILLEMIPSFWCSSVVSASISLWKISPWWFF